jgi:DEAD/DEAH box helicase
VNDFHQLHPAIRYHIVNTLGWSDLRPTQRDSIAPIHQGENVLLLAPTAGGKTEAAVLPLLSRAASERWTGLSVLYLGPLKVLLNNLEPRLAQYTGFVGRRASLWHGDVGAALRKRVLKDPPDLLLTTPESVEAILVSARIDHLSFLGGVRAVVVDECARGNDVVPTTVTFGNPSVACPWRVSAGLATRMRQLHPSYAALLMNKPDDSSQRLNVIIHPDAQVLRANPALGKNCRRFCKH